MKTTSSFAWPSGTRRTSSTLSVLDAWAQAPARLRAFFIAAGVLAIALLWSFYAVVSASVQRAENGREQARVALERAAVCSAFSATSSRDLCLLTVATRTARTPVVHALYQQPPATVRDRQLAAALY